METVQMERAKFVYDLWSNSWSKMLLFSVNWHEKFFMDTDTTFLHIFAKIRLSEQRLRMTIGHFVKRTEIKLHDSIYVHGK